MKLLEKRFERNVNARVCVCVCGMYLFTYKRMFSYVVEIRDDNAAQILPLVHRHAVQHARRGCAPEVRVRPLERQHEYVPRARQVQQRQEQSEHGLPPAEFADCHRHRIRVRLFRAFVITENPDVA